MIKTASALKISAAKKHEADSNDSSSPRRTNVPRKPKTIIDP